jgi:hypothetical protein
MTQTGGVFDTDYNTQLGAHAAGRRDAGRRGQA